MSIRYPLSYKPRITQLPLIPKVRIMHGATYPLLHTPSLCGALNKQGANFTFYNITKNQTEVFIKPSHKNV